MSKEKKEAAGQEEQAQVDEILNEEPIADDQENSPEAEPELSPEDSLRLERDAFKEKWLRVVAELDNVRKRSRRELVDGRRFAQAEALRAFLEVQDNFERALQSMGNDGDTGTGKNLREGVELIFQNFRRVLKDQGVQPIEAMGQEFDPTVHEAVGQLPREGVEPGHVIEVVQQGFQLGELILRPSRVIISS